MSKKDKKRKQKKVRGKRGVLPSSVQALLGYLGSGGPAPALQGDTKLRERAGIDAYDTLHQIIKSQQMMSANYMANLERMAFKNEITDQLKKQGEESKKEVGKVIESAVEKATRTYVKRSPEEKIAERQKQIEFQIRKGTGANQETISKYEADIRRYQGLLDYRRENYAPNLSLSDNQEANLPSASGSTTLLGQFRPSVGGGGESVRTSVAQAQSSSVGADIRPFLKPVMADLGGPQLPAQDPRGAGGGSSAEVSEALKGFQSSEYVASSGTGEPKVPPVIPSSKTGRKKK